MFRVFFYISFNFMIKKRIWANNVKNAKKINLKIRIYL